MSQEEFSFYKEHPKTCARDDFWGQVKRTVNGKSVSQEQIDMIIHAIISGLNLNRDDRLLDLCCGNGALSTHLFRACSGGLGVDFSEHLIGVAKEFFEEVPREVYRLSDVVTFVSTERQTDQYTKVLCYGSFPYLSFRQAYDLLKLIKDRYVNVKRIFIGNLPDKELLEQFYRDREYKPGMENDPDSMIGIWRTRDEFIELAASCGWNTGFSKMPAEFYASHYRYDATLIPMKGGRE